jgi:hypothetical protein
LSTNSTVTNSTDGSGVDNNDSTGGSGSGRSDSTLPRIYDACMTAARARYPQANEARIQELCQHATRRASNDSTDDGKLGACLSALRIVPGDHQQLCARIIADRSKCQEILAGANFPNAAAVCTRLFNPVPIAAQPKTRQCLKMR